MVIQAPRRHLWATHSPPRPKPGRAGDGRPATAHQLPSAGNQAACLHRSLRASLPQAKTDPWSRGLRPTVKAPHDVRAWGPRPSTRFVDARRAAGFEHSAF